MPKLPRALPVKSFQEALQQYLHYCGGRVIGKVRIQGQEIGALIEARAYGERKYVDGSRIRDLTSYLGFTEKSCVVFKRDWYKNFGRHFPGVDPGWGQISNLKLLWSLQRKGISKLVAVMPGGVAYSIPVRTFLRYYDEFKTDVPHLPGEIASPIKMWTREYPK